MTIHIKGVLELSSGHKDINDNGSNNKFILVVDDEYDIANLVKQSLQKNGTKVSVFTDPVMALEEFKNNCTTCGLILSDIRMPGMNGYELLKKAKEIDKQVRVVLMSAFEIEGKEFHNMLPDVMVDGFLQKPFSPQQLNDLVQNTGI
ncbi:MAG TPA: response regulator [Nitrososphaeraceae archaeon]|nr:response regulator [Nitrososphaeraceae archaeon]